MQRDMYPAVIAKLEVASGPSHQLDLELAFVLRLPDDPGKSRFVPIRLGPISAIYDLTECP